MKIEPEKLEVTFRKVVLEEGDEAPVYGICAFNQKRFCGHDCTALAIMAIPRTRMVWDSQHLQFSVVADREPVIGPFCRRGNFPIGIHADEKTVSGIKEKKPDVAVG